MRLSDLAAESGVSVPTIKYYLREGLLPPGRPVTARQADYGEEHLARLRLIRALLDVAGLSVHSVRDVLAAVTGPGGVREAVAVAHGALPPRPATGGEVTRARRAMDALGWQFDPGSSATHQLEVALAATESVGLEPSAQRLRVYAEAALQVAAVDVADVGDNAATGGDPVRYVVLGTVLYEPLLLALRRLAQAELYRRSHDRPAPDALR